MNLREAIYHRLSTDSTLTAMLKTPTSIYHHLAPEGAHPAYIVFGQQAATSEWAFQRGRIKWPIWQVKAIDRGSSASRAEDISARVEELLTDAELDVEGFTHLYLRPESEIDLPGADTGEKLFTVGAIYRVALGSL